MSMENENKTNEYHDENNRFKEGNPGGGRPKGSTKSDITSAIREALAKRVDATDPNSKTKKTMLVEKILEKAIEEGDQQLIKQIWEQLDGKPTQKTEHTGEDGKPIQFTIAGEIAGKNNIRNKDSD